jgi:cytochrome c-type biogenesis protein CcmH
MTTFVVVAAFMAVFAAAAVAVPLCRDRQSRVLGAIAGVLVVGAAAGLYPLWSNWNWRAPAVAQAAGPDVAAMVGKLEAHLREDPNDLTGWLMLGRSYLTLERLDDAILAYDHALRLDANSPDAALGLGEAQSLRAGGNITPSAAALFEQALQLAPSNPKALLYGGFAAEARGDTAAARARWQTLKDLHPPEQIEKMLDERIAELGPVNGTPGAAAGMPPGGGGPEAGTPPDVASTGARGIPDAPPGAVRGADATSPQAGNAGVAGAEAGPSAPSAEATVNISIAPGLKARLTGGAPLFVFAREPGGRGPPLAAKRLTSAAIGTQIHLTPADSMISGRTLVSGQRVSITARVSFSGQPLPAAGDLYGELTYDVGHDGARDLVIDRVAE